MTKTYVHAPVNVTIGPEDRGYWLEEELLEYKGMDVLCIHSKASSCRFCDGSAISNLYTIFVKGYVVPDRYRVTRNGEVITEFQPIDVADRPEIDAALREKWGIAQIYFD